MNVLLLKAWLAEHGPGLIGCRIRQVRQHDDRTVLLELAGDDGAVLLLLSVLEEYPVLALIEDESQLPPAGASDGNFAKALTFHLAGYALIGITQTGYDRSVIFTWHSKDTYGQETQKRLRHELAGRASNAFLISERGMVVSIMKRVRREQNRVRYIQTGKALPEPPALDKYVAAQTGEDGLAAELAALAQRDGLEDPLSLEHFFTKRVACCDVKLWPALEPLVPVEYDLETMTAFINRLQRGEYTAQLFGIGVDNRSVNQIAYAAWLAARAKRGRSQPKPDLMRQRVLTRLDQLREHQLVAARADDLEQLALELLRTAADHDAAGEAAAVLQAWQAAHPEWASLIALDTSVYNNAQELVHAAQRYRRGREKMEQAIAEAEQELVRLEQAAPAAPHHPPARRAAQSTKKLTAKHLRYVSSDGMVLICGVSDFSNDGLLRELGSGRHVWLHARDYPGSHVFVLDAARSLPWRTLTEAAIVAAYHSQGRNEAELDVSYTPVNQLRRPRTGKPGQVLKLSEKVIRVKPADFEELKAGLLGHAGG